MGFAATTRVMADWFASVRSERVGGRLILVVDHIISFLSSCQSRPPSWLASYKLSLRRVSGIAPWHGQSLRSSWLFIRKVLWAKARPCVQYFVRRLWISISISKERVASEALGAFIPVHSCNCGIVPAYRSWPDPEPLGSVGKSHP